jgi:hypothetical protein
MAATHHFVPIERPFSEAFLSTYSDEHLFYECDMFFWLAQVCGSGATLGAPTAADATRMSNVLIEGFAVHLRNVIDFLYLDRPQKTDIVAADFCTPGTWVTVRPSISQTLETARGRANKEIAHLSTQRIAGSAPGKAWAFKLLASELRPILHLVARHAVPGRLGSRLVAVLR